MEAFRATYDQSCSYERCLNRAMPKWFYNELKELAPKIKYHDLAEIVINRYNPGDYISAHRDRTIYSYNMVIALQTGEDGINIQDTFYPDEAGRAVTFTLTGVEHSVPPVKNLRHSLIYLYE